jgi:RNA polymerase sigma-70 factor, ECF subfamily
MKRYVEGDESAFAELFRRYAPRLHSFFRRSFREEAAVEDLVQQTFLKLHHYRESYDVGRPFRPWFYTIASGLRKDALRKLYRLPPAAGEDEFDRAEASESPPPLPRLSNEKSLEERVQAAVDSLPESQRVVVQLHRFEHLTFEEVAKAMNMSPGAVRVRASRAYSALRVLLEPVANEEAV